MILWYVLDANALARKGRRKLKMKQNSELALIAFGFALGCMVSALLINFVG
ncbi:hypothetical protein N_092 [Cronobacter phage vB_CsaM_leN]|uniref:Uncharacterized protein n=2 Tax=Pseudotevenvirus leb TaxID=2844035 RepID=A0A1W5N135_9CAUD|nr:hypothetical protein N_092 [Cronobacter phage vB_CsaM_leN]